MLTVFCPQCGMALSATEADVGKSGQCSRCGTVFTIQVPASPQPPPVQPPPVPDAAPIPPVGPYAAAAPVWPSLALSKVRGPAISLLIAGIFGVIGNLCGVAGGFGGDQEIGPLPPDMPPEMQELIQSITQILSGPAQVILSLVGLGISAFTIWGSIRMMNLRSYGLAMTATILVMIPCVSPCCCFLPFAIWSLVVLLQADVQAAFRATAGA